MSTLYLSIYSSLFLSLSLSLSLTFGNLIQWNALIQIGQKQSAIDSNSNDRDRKRVSGE